MTPDQIDTAIAEFRGWTEIQRYPESGRLWGNRPGSEGESYRLNAVPQFHRCLNAMAEASRSLGLGRGTYITWIKHLWSVCPIDAPANVRAEALLRTIGNYQEPEKLSTHCVV